MLTVPIRLSRMILFLAKTSIIRGVNLSDDLVTDVSSLPKDSRNTRNELTR